MDSLKIKRLCENAVLPKRATPGSAGMDLYACLDNAVTVEPHCCFKFHTGIAIALPSPDYGAFIFARSGLSVNHGLAPANCVGVVDSDYRGEIIVGLVNQFDTPYTVEPGERIAQLVILPVSLMGTEECDELDDTQRGEGGFGSTGRT
ncbi:MAG: dUTP diphosphatase [Clostridiales bacterium]|nr:dUTP diphosphatase [Clostridiales bacterium]MCD7827726.1 dUTP diphosphatase [Clostridiales bacterium]